MACHCHAFIAIALFGQTAKIGRGKNNIVLTLLGAFHKGHKIGRSHEIDFEPQCLRQVFYQGTMELHQLRGTDIGKKT
jgi:hypothetical protein